MNGITLRNILPVNSNRSTRYWNKYIKKDYGIKNKEILSVLGIGKRVLHKITLCFLGQIKTLEHIKQK